MFEHNIKPIISLLLLDSCTLDSPAQTAVYFPSGYFSHTIVAFAVKCESIVI